MAHRYKVIQGGPYPHHVTCSIVNWLPVFIAGPYYQIIIDSFAYLRANRNVGLHAYAIMPTHLHAILSSQQDDLSAVMRDFKKFTSRAIYAQASLENNALLVRAFQKAAEVEPHSRFRVWQAEFHPKVILTPDVFLERARYIHLNPVRKGLVDNAENWLYSSAANYTDLATGPIEIDPIEW